MTETSPKIVWILGSLILSFETFIAIRDEVLTRLGINALFININTPIFIYIFKILATSV